MAKILLTGAGGYVGNILAKKLLQSGYEIIALLKDSKEQTYEGCKVFPLDKFSIQDIFNEVEIDGIIHLATCYGRNGESTQEIANSNIIFPLMVLKEAIKNNVKFFINTDSILSPKISEYALSKNQFRQWLNFYKDNIIAVNLRIDHFFGPFDKPNKFIAFILHELHKNVSYINLTEGNQKRDFIYIDDLISAYQILVENALNDKFLVGEEYNFDVVSGIQTSIKEAVLACKELTGNTKTTLNFGALSLRKGEIPAYNHNIEGLHKLGWKANITFREGIKKIIEIEKLKR